MVAGALALAGEAEGASEAEVRVVVDRVALDHGLELGRRLGELAVAKVGAAERLADRALLRRPPGDLLQPHGRLAEAAVLEQLDALAIEGVRVVGRAHV